MATTVATKQLVTVISLSNQRMSVSIVSILKQKSIDAASTYLQQRAVATRTSRTLTQSEVDVINAAVKDVFKQYTLEPEVAIATPQETTETTT